MATTIHNFDPRTGALVSSEPAAENPRRPGVPILPAHATTLAPPAAQPGRVPVFRAGAWSLVADLRGQTWWTADGAVRTMADLGPLPAGAIPVPPSSPAHRWDGAAWTVPPAWASKEAARAAVVAAIEAVEGAVAGLRSWGERESWRDQEPAARAILAGAADHEGMAVVDGIRSVTGETREALAARVVANADLFRGLIGPLVGYRRAIHAAIDAAPTLAGVEAVTRDGLEQIAAFGRQASQGETQ